MRTYPADLARRAFTAALLGTSLLVTAPAWGRETRPAAAEVAGMSTERLARLRGWMQGEVDAGRIPGAVLIVTRHGKVAFHEAVGRQGPGADAPPMRKDSIFRIYSMTKPIATVAAMMLVEEGKLLLEAPVARYIPEFASVKVAVEKPDPAGGKPTVEMVPARRPITVQDLMRHTSGLTYGFFGDSAAKRAYNEAGIDAGADITNAEFAVKVASLPLGFQPGSTWDYSYSTDVLGRVIEVAAGKPLGTVLRERLFEPLGMRDTMFYLTDAGRQARLAEPLDGDRAIGTGVGFNDPRVARKSEPAGQGLVGTATDYARFAQMMLQGGWLDGRRYLSPQTVAYMTADHLGASVARTPLYLPGPGYGFGLGFAVRTAQGEAAAPGNVGEFYWGGAGGTYFWIDPQADLQVVFMMQSPKQRGPYRSILRNMVYASIVR